MHIVIIGNSAAGLICIEAFRKHDRTSRVTVIGKETRRPYSRVLLPYYLRGKVAQVPSFDGGPPVVHALWPTAVETGAIAGHCLPQTCMHCDEAWCLEICPAAAVVRNCETGAIEIDSDRCAGCKMCILACPFGNIHLDKINMVSRKCNLCMGEPNCMSLCISGVLQYTTPRYSIQNNLEIFQRFIKAIDRNSSFKET